jgi:hypothetical protein
VGRLGADVDVLDLAEVGLGALELERVPELVLGGDVQGPLGERPDLERQPLHRAIAEKTAVIIKTTKPNINTLLPPPNTS